MTQDFTQILSSACGTGEIITVCYNGGTHPGHPRKLVAHALHDDMLIASDFGSSQRKTYKMEKVAWVEFGDGARYVNHDAPPSEYTKPLTRIVPADYFENWHYEIHSALWPALGVNLREYIDKEKTKSLREEKKASGTSKKDLVRFKITYKVYVVSEPPIYDFHEGDMFYSRHGKNAIQVASVQDAIEAHAINPGSHRTAFHLTDNELAAWLETGETPTGKQITFTQSKCEVLRYFLIPERCGTDDNFSRVKGES